MKTLQGIGTLDATYPAEPGTVPAARRALVDFALGLGVPTEQVEAIRLSASEALTNVVLHAYRGRPGQIHVTAELAAGELWVLIADDGTGLRSDNESSGLGVGLALIARSSDGLTIMNRAGGGTEVRMRFNLRHGGGRRSDHSRELRRSAISPASPRFCTTT